MSASTRVRLPQWRIAADLFRRAPGQRWTLALAAVAVAAGVTVLLLVASVFSGVGARADRLAWLTPRASDQPVARQVTTTTFLDHRPVTVVHLAPESSGGEAVNSPPDVAALPAPPGLAVFPRPGQVALSAALAATLGDRGEALGLGSKVDPALATRLGSSATAGPDDLVAVVGHAPGAPEVRGPALRDVTGQSYIAGPTPIRDFTGDRAASVLVGQYLPSVVLAGGLLVVPVLGLLSAAAGLGAASRSRRFARLRLAGTPCAVLRRLALIEALATAAVGVMGGLLVHLVLLPAVAHIPLAGSQFALRDLLVPLPMIGLVTAVCAAVLVLRVRHLTRDAIGAPLATAHALPGTLPLWWRVGLALAAGAAFVAASRSDQVSLTLALIVLLLVFGVVSVFGPIVVALVGRALLLRPTAPRLLAGRRLLHDPRAAWRPLSGVVLAGFVAGFFALFAPDAGTVVHGRETLVQAVVSSTEADAATTRLAAELRVRGVAAEVLHDQGAAGALFAIRGQGVQLDTLSVPVESPQVRAALGAALPAAPIASGLDTRELDARYPQDIRRASIVLLITAFALAIASLTVSAITGISERRAHLRTLRATGTPLRVIDVARRREALDPLVVCTLLAACLGALLAAPLVISQGSVPLLGLGSLALALGLGVAGAALALRWTRRQVAAASRP